MSLNGCKLALLVLPSSNKTLRLAVEGGLSKYVAVSLLHSYAVGGSILWSSSWPFGEVLRAEGAV